MKLEKNVIHNLKPTCTDNTGKTPSQQMFIPNYNPLNKTLSLPEVIKSQSVPGVGESR